MRETIHYECGICRDRFNTAEAALSCEARGIPEPPPIGLIFGSTTGFYAGMTFAIARVETASNPHYLNTSLLAARDTGAGDSRRPDDLCGSTGYHTAWPSKDDAANPEHPTFWRVVRMVREWLHQEPLCWDGEKAVPLADFVKNCAGYA